MQEINETPEQNCVGLTVQREARCTNDLLSCWKNVEDGLPSAGDYDVRLIRNGETLEARKRLVIAGDKHKWFGGMRPFCENDVVTHYKVENQND